MERSLAASPRENVQMPTFSILVVEDEDDIRSIICHNLTREGFITVGAASGEEAIKLLNGGRFDLVLLDLMLPGIDGIEVARRMKARPDTSSIPIIMLTAKDSETDVVVGLTVGADDYVTKPFTFKVLSARIRAVLRRGEPVDSKTPEVMRVRDLVIHPGRFQVLCKGCEIVLTPTEFSILQFLASRPGWVFTRAQIISSVHGDGFAVTDRSVDVQIVGLRKKMGEAGRYIETVRGVGYRFLD